MSVQYLTPFAAYSKAPVINLACKLLTLLKCKNLIILPSGILTLLKCKNLIILPSGMPLSKLHGPAYAPPCAARIP